MAEEPEKLSDLDDKWFRPIDAARLPDETEECKTKREARAKEEATAEMKRLLEKFQMPSGNSGVWRQVSQPLYDQATIPAGGVVGGGYVFAPYIQVGEARNVANTQWVTTSAATGYTNYYSFTGEQGLEPVIGSDPILNHNHSDCPESDIPEDFDDSGTDSAI